MIPIYIPSYNRANTIKTTKYLDSDDIPYKVLLHSENCKKEYLKYGIVKEENILVTNAPFGITNQRNWILKNLAQWGKWYISLDDNIDGFKKVVDKYYVLKKKINVEHSNVKQEDYNDPLKANKFIKLLEDDIKLADSLNIEYVGFATVDNYFFNPKKYKTVGYVISKACAIKYMGLTYDIRLEAMEDFGFCAEQLIKNNAVLINSWIKPIAGHYEKGGIGTYEQ